MKKTWMPPSAAALQFLASAPYLVLSLELYFVPGYLPDALGGGRIWGAVGFLVWFPFALPLLVGGFSSLLRKAWGVALIGTLLPLVLTVFLAPWQGTRISTALFYSTSFPRVLCQIIEFLAYLFMVAAAVLMVWARDEFTGRKSAAEHLYGPPKGWKGTED
jgi:hypothetical protein